MGRLLVIRVRQHAVDGFLSEVSVLNPLCRVLRVFVAYKGVRPLVYRRYLGVRRLLQLRNEVSTFVGRAIIGLRRITWLPVA